MDSAYSVHLSNTIKQCQVECAEAAGERLEEVKLEANNTEDNLNNQLQKAMVNIYRLLFRS